MLRPRALLLGLLVSTVFSAGQTTPSPLPTPDATTPAVPLTPLDDATQKLRHGDYAGAAALAQKTIANSYPSEDLLRIEAEALLTEGKYTEAYDALRNGMAYNSSSVRLLLLLRQACLYTGKTTEADQILADIKSTLDILNVPQPGSPPALLADCGEAQLLLHLDPKTILQQYFAPSEQAKPPVRDAFLDSGQLGLDKHDYQLASASFADGLKAFPDDADMLYGLAAAFRPNDRVKFADYAQQALAINPNHIPTLLMLADNLIDAESFDEARDVLKKILTINPHEQNALALQAVIAYLRNQPAQGEAYRTQALSTWGANPRVDYVIGKKLSENYRFELGAKFQRQALASDPKFTPATVQLAQDLLRLGQEDEGWKLAAQAHADDGYDVEAFNLVTLHDEIANYTTISADGFNLVMDPTEARVYGPRVMDLLKKARATLPAKYGLDLSIPVLVEVFPNPADFSVRTFGMPDIGEFLGVTFGPVVTLNSPSTHESNWEDVLWHEFTHVVTLTLTRNQMPRWLSEGISVYEETQGNPAWGDKMSLDDYQRIMSGKMQPISNMSAAFLQAKTLEDTQFAYFESMLVVQFLNEKYGLDHVKTLLRDIGSGMLINDAFAKNFAPLTQLDDQFAQYARQQAQAFAKGWFFRKPDETATTTATSPATLTGAALAEPSLVPSVDPHDFYARMKQITDLMDQEEWAKARDQINDINATGLYLPGDENLYLLLAEASAKLGDTAGEKAALTVVADHEGDSLAAASRLLEIAEDEKNWKDVARWSEANIAIHPMGVSGWRGLLDASEQLHDNAHGIEAGLALLNLQQPDIASLHYRVAKLMAPTDVAGARRQVLQALEEAPRFRAAYDLLATLPSATADTPPPAPVQTSATAPAASSAGTPQ